MKYEFLVFSENLYFIYWIGVVVLRKINNFYDVLYRKFMLVAVFFVDYNLLSEARLVSVIYFIYKFY